MLGALGAKLGGWIGRLLATEAVRPYTSRWLYFGLLRKERPSYLSSCWHYPVFPLSSRALLPTSGQEPDVLFLPMMDWHTRIQRTQHLALGLAAAGHRCFYVNPHLGFQFPKSYFRDRNHRLAILAPRLMELHVRLLREPVVHHRLPTRGECRTIVEAVSLAIRAARVGRLVQVVSLPFWLEVAVQLRQTHGFPVVYDCHDLLGGFSGVKEEVRAREADLFRLSDLTIFSSQPLMDAKISEFPCLRDRSLLVRNAAVSNGLLRNGADERSEVSGGQQKVIGYVGALDDWFDVSAVAMAARSRPEWKFVLIGRVESRSVLTLRELPNVVFLGELPHPELRTYFASFDVGLIPFLRNDLTLAANPIKLYEYLSYGIPVVSTRLPEVEVFGELVYVADGPQDFARKVEAAATEGAFSLRQRRREAVHKETWSDRVLRFETAFAGLAWPAWPSTGNGKISGHAE